MRSIITVFWWHIVHFSRFQTSQTVHRLIFSSSSTSNVIFHIWKPWAQGCGFRVAFSMYKSALGTFWFVFFQTFSPLNITITVKEAKQWQGNRYESYHTFGPQRPISSNNGLLAWALSRGSCVMISSTCVVLLFLSNTSRLDLGLVTKCVEPLIFPVIVPVI